MQIKWLDLGFEELSNRQLFDIVRLRQSVFIIEQECPYPDLDEKDLIAQHLLAYDGDRLVAYTRLLNRSISFEGALSIGRVVVAPSHRGQGLSYQLMARSIERCYELYGNHAIVIGAQAHLERMYAQLGFKVCSDGYLEDGIPHLDMRLEQS